MTKARNPSVSDGSGLEVTACKKNSGTTTLLIPSEKSDDARKQSQLFTATAVHDLKGHLQMISSGISLLRRNYHKVLDLKGNEILIAMSNGVVHMKELIDDILILSALKEECHRLDLVDLNDLALSVVGDLQPAFISNQAKISIEKLPIICGDKAQLYQVFQNLLTNALKYRKPEVDPIIIIRSQLALSSDPHTTDYLHEIIIEDNGVGFTNEQAALIFESFQRLNNPGIEGSGLGLSICQRIVLGHKGHIRAEGVPGVGAKFFVQLPSIACCEKSDHCPFAEASNDKKCPALKLQKLETSSAS